MLEFALNQVTMANAPLGDVLKTAQRLGCVGVELRNDLKRPLFDGLAAKDAGAMVRDHGLRLLGLSQIYPCNRWSETIAKDSQSLIESAVEAEAEAISLIPYNDGDRWQDINRVDQLVTGLEAIHAMLRQANMKAFFEPLGFQSSSSRLKSEAIEILRSFDATDCIKIVHDTFHHYLAEEDALFPAETGIVHISGLADVSIQKPDMADAHRGLVTATDQLGSVQQIIALIDAGYTGAFSFECFAPEVHNLAAPEAALRQSMNFIASHTQQRAA